MTAGGAGRCWPAQRRIEEMVCPPIPMVWPSGSMVSSKLIALPQAADRLFRPGADGSDPCGDPVVGQGCGEMASTAGSDLGATQPGSSRWRRRPIGLEEHRQRAVQQFAEASSRRNAEQEGRGEEQVTIPAHRRAACRGSWRPRRGHADVVLVAATGILILLRIGSRAGGRRGAAPPARATGWWSPDRATLQSSSGLRSRRSRRCPCCRAG